MNPPIGAARASGRALPTVAMLFQTIFSAATFLAAKSVLGAPGAPGPIGAFELLTLRFALAAGLLVPILITVPGIAAHAAAHAREALLLGFLAVPLNVGFFFAGAARAPASHPALAYALTPVFVYLLERAAGRRQGGLRRVGGLALALAGAIVVLARSQLSGPEPAGDALLLCAVGAWALYTVRSRALIARIGARATLALSLTAGTLLWLPAGAVIAARIPYDSLSAVDWACVGYTAVVTTVINYSLWLYSLKRLEASQVAVFSNLQPIATVLLAWWILGEPVTVTITAATALVLAGVTFVQKS